MTKRTLPFFNLSLAKVLDTEPDSLKKARISIIFAITIFSIIKLLVALPGAVIHNQDVQIIRIVLFLGVLAVLLKFLLISRHYAGKVGVILIWLALSLTWSNVFVTAQTINIVTIQVVVTIILSSFYLFNWRWALIYSFLAVLPVTGLLIIGNGVKFSGIAPEELASPSYEIVVVLNFLTIVIAHFLYYQALNNYVAEKEMLNKQLQKAVKEANLAVQSKADFLSTMSHELRTPLNSVIGMTQLLLNSPYSDEQSENLKIVNFSAMNLHMLINDILDFNKMESDKLNLEAINVDLYSLVKDICSGMRFQAEEKGLHLVTNIDEALKSNYVITDPTRLTQIIHNLLGNAVKFTHKGTVSLEVRVIHLNPESVDVRFTVSDTGIGIETQQQEVIFEAFTQASSSTTRNFGGTGLGLTIVKRLLKLFESDIKVASTVGKGSDFVFEISFKAAVSDDASAQNTSKIIYDLSQLSVLVVEDNPINSLLIKKIFSNWDNKPVFAENGHEALEKIERNNFDVILMDIHMPLLDGYETTRLIRNLGDKSKASIPVIALTASVSNDLSFKIREAGMNDYINKPFNSDDLYRKLKAIDIVSPQIIEETLQKNTA
ncbi:ATP-binding protein [Daejeonella lutea]|uniref:histidine kinase n=1 Tax=Daejeonella lutea TaxID=572036 RepID=A0A1T5A8S2_9SPHI|nr:ATP-binding protein [Daejeonella lutea]SKB31394.1 Signal transduction histidine kinase [Daejeonella lutea]